MLGTFRPSRHHRSDCRSARPGAAREGSAAAGRIQEEQGKRTQRRAAFERWIAEAFSPHCSGPGLPNLAAHDLGCTDRVYVPGDRLHRDMRGNDRIGLTTEPGHLSIRIRYRGPSSEPLPSSTRRPPACTRSAPPPSRRKRSSAPPPSRPTSAASRGSRVEGRDRALGVASWARADDLSLALVQRAGQCGVCG